MTAPRILFVNRFYWPDESATAQLLTDLATALAARGHDVEVIASASRDVAGPLTETRDGVRIHRVRVPDWGRRHVPGRLVDFAAFYLGASWRLARRLRRDDCVVVMTDPPLLGIVAALVAMLRRASLIHWVQDIYPEIAAQITGHGWLLALRPPRNWAWRRARACVVPGRDMCTALASAGVGAGRIVVSNNWAPRGLAAASPATVDDLRRTWRLEGKFVVAYSGNLGRVHDLEPLLDVAALLQAEPDFAFVFIGGGAQRAALEAAARARGLRNVHFHPPQPRATLSVSLALADVHWVTLLPGAEKSVFPSKLYGIAAAGRPALVIAAAGCELAAVVRQQAMGAAFTRTELAAAARWLRDTRADPAERARLSAAASAFAADGFTRALHEWQRVIGPGLAAPAVSPYHEANR